MTDTKSQTVENSSRAMGKWSLLREAYSRESSKGFLVFTQVWIGAIQNYWNEITQTAALQHNLTTAQSARVFALLDLAIADTVIAFYDASTQK
jgi:hypothetical protein